MSDSQAMPRGASPRRPDALLATFDPHDRVKLRTERALYPMGPWLVGALAGAVVYMVVKMVITLVPMAPVVGFGRVGTTIMQGLVSLLFIPSLCVLPMKLMTWRPVVERLIRHRLKHPPRPIRNEQTAVRLMTIFLWAAAPALLALPAATTIYRVPAVDVVNHETVGMVVMMVAGGMIFAGFIHRRGHDLVCVICDYPRRQDDPVKCPECGLERVPPHGLRLGVRDRNWRLVGVGLALMTLAVVVRVVTM